MAAAPGAHNAQHLFSRSVNVRRTGSEHLYAQHLLCAHGAAAMKLDNVVIEKIIH